MAYAVVVVVDGGNCVNILVNHKDGTSFRDVPTVISSGWCRPLLR